MDTTVKNFIQTLKSLSWRFNEDIVRFIFLFEFCDITALLLSALNFRVAAWILLKSPSIVCPLPPLQMNAGAAVLKALLRVLMRRIWRWKGLLLFHNSFFFPVKKSLVTVKVKLPCIFCGVDQWIWSFSLIPVWLHVLWWHTEGELNCL